MLHDAHSPALLAGFLHLPSQFVVIDSETTGFIDENGTPPGLLSLGIVTVVDGVIVDSTEFLINPQSAIEDQATHVHGITQAQADAWPPLQKHWPLIFAHIQGQHVYAHNAAFDWQVLEGNARRYSLQMPAVASVNCTLRMAQPWAEVNRFCTYARGPSLDSLTRITGAQDLRKESGVHGAKVDALQLADVMLRLARYARANGALGLA